MCEWQDNDFDEKLTCQNWKRWRPLEEVAAERLEESGTPEVHDSFLKFISMFCANYKSVPSIMLDTRVPLRMWENLLHDSMND